MLPNEAFVRTRISDILSDTARLSNISYMGIESYPLQEYLFQSTFIKMTGYLEQKIKCICWDIASIDYKFRYKILNEWNNWGTFSDYKKIKQVYDKILTNIKEHDSEYELNKSTGNICFREIREILEESNLISFEEREYFKYKNDSKYFNDKKIEDFSPTYEKLYEKRNSLAHNTKVYQKDLPRLNDLRAKQDSDKDNYYYFFTVLAIYDCFFVSAYNACIELISEKYW